MTAPATIVFTAAPEPRQPKPQAGGAPAPLRAVPREGFRLLRARLRALAAHSGRPTRRIAVVSACAGEGKTLVALGLARALAEGAPRVLLVECDLRRPSLEESLGLERARGLGEWLESEERTVRTEPLSPGLELLPAGHCSRPEVLGSPRMAELLEAAARCYDAVVLDCPPLLPVADSVILQDLVDGLLFVVRFRHSPRNTVRKALDLLSEGRLLGFVYNGHHEIIPGEYGYATRRYGGQGLD